MSKKRTGGSRRVCALTTLSPWTSESAVPPRTLELSIPQRRRYFFTKWFIQPGCVALFCVYGKSVWMFKLLYFSCALCSLPSVSGKERNVCWRYCFLLKQSHFHLSMYRRSFSFCESSSPSLICLSPQGMITLCASVSLSWPGIRVGKPCMSDSRSPESSGGRRCAVASPCSSGILCHPH